MKEKRISDVPERSEVDDRHKWDPSAIFADDEQWETAFEKLKRKVSGITKFKGRLRSAPAALACLEFSSSITRDFYLLNLYAGLKRDEDTRNTKYQGYRDMLSQLGTECGELGSYIEPELLLLPADDLKAMIRDPRFANHDFHLKELLRQKKHVLSQESEALVAALSLGSGGTAQAYSLFSNADLKFPKVKGDDGKEVELTQSNFSLFRASGKRAVRYGAFNAMFGTLHGFRNTLAAMLSSFIKEEVAGAKVRKHKSALYAALDSDNVPAAVYSGMIEAVNAHLPLLHRYLRLRQRMMKLDSLRYHDLYPPLVKGSDMRFSHEDACRLVLEACEPMGPVYTDILKSALDPSSGWVDVFPNRGKRSGAYMNSVPGVHPFVLTNFVGTYSSVSTLAHEMGHAMHSWFSYANQPFEKSDYPIFVAEVASTLNEALLMSRMLEKASSKKDRLFLLGEKMEDFRQTVFRQAMFAEFELGLYEAVELQNPLTPDTITDAYLEVVRKYYGHDAGVVTVDDLYGMEWAYIPHFYYGFYVYQYATGLTAATALARKILDDGPKARDRYIKHLLMAGGSDHPVKLLRRAGADMTKREAYDIAMRDFESTLEEVERLVG